MTSPPPTDPARPIDLEQLAQWPSTPGLRWPCPLAVIDLETTGLDPASHALTEIAVIRLDETFGVTGRSAYLVQVDEPGEVDPWVVENTAWGRDRARWNRYAWPLDRALEKCGRLLGGAALVAQYLPFEARWLRHLYQRQADDCPGRDWVLSERWRRHSIDTRDLASPLVATGQIKSRSLPALAEHLGVRIERHHSARLDALATLEILRRLLRGTR